ncbi:MAG: fibrobacter succinogenes major paralogous domain-containing protein [Fibrobacteraceae bacterium]|nr:fibrobacter succinogenes major paralogous domain-containing protein [Fibrobacteraceae bacterium]
MIRFRFFYCCALALILLASCGDDTPVSSSLGLPNYDSSSSTASSSSRFKVSSSSSYATSYSSANFLSSSSINVQYSVMEDSRDGRSYQVVKIGNQVWMAENLNYLVPNPKNDLGMDVVWSWCYRNDTSNCSHYGRLYTWAATMDSLNQGGCGLGVTCKITEPHRGICPEGWHVPTKEEFVELYDYVGGIKVAAVKLKSTEDWVSNANGTNDYGFSLLPGGFRNINGEFIRINEHANIWSATETSETYVVDQYFDQYQNINLDQFTKSDGHSVRCVKD